MVTIVYSYIDIKNITCVVLYFKRFCVCKKMEGAFDKVPLNAKKRTNSVDKHENNCVLT